MTIAFASTAKRRSAFTAVALALVAAASTAFVASGVPLLRQDWFPIVPSVRFAIENITGWDPTGLGNVVGYPASFVLIFVRSVVAAIVGPYATHLLYFAAYTMLLTFGAARLATVLGASRFARVAAALFAAFNPWVYTELVAGHAFMLLSYAATFWLVAECCARTRSPLRLVLLALAVAPQIQFLIVDAAFYAWLSLRMRSWIVVLAIGAMLLPVFVGIVASHDVLVGIPLTLEWERGQSIDPFRATVLRGYFTGYDTVLAPFYEWSQWAIVALSCVGVVTILLVQRRRAWLIAFAAIPLIWSFGTIGPFGSFFSWTITHISEAGLFRELYGLLGFVAVGYVAFCAIGTSRWRPLEAVWFAAGLAMLVGWMIAPPQQFWVPSGMLPVTEIQSTPNSRFLLAPALYPARSFSRGSGTDPDLYPRAANMTPVNESIPMYPVSKAIGRYLRDGSTDELAALGVSRIVARAWLQTDPSIRFQLALPLPDWIAHAASTSRSVPHALPELTVGGFPAIGTLDANFGAGNVFFGDARGVTGAFAPPGWRDFAVVRAIEPDNVFVSAADGWVDARLAFVEDPDLAQPYGGAVTTNASATLPVVPGFALVFARGALLARDGTPIVTNSGGYRWVAVHENVRAVRCAGLCVVAAEAAQVPSAPLDPPSQHSEGVAFSTPIPWFVSAELPAGSLPLLRYNVRFDPKWAAFFDGTALPHLRIDGAVNGWLVPPRAHAAKVYLIETGAALTTLSEIVAVTIVCSLVFYALRNPTKESAFAIDPTASNETTM